MLRCGAKSRWLTWKNNTCEQGPGNVLKNQIAQIRIKISNHLYPTMIMEYHQSILGAVVVISRCSFEVRHVTMVRM